MLDTILLICAFASFLLKALGVPIWRLDLMNLGFAFLVLTLLV